MFRSGGNFILKWEFQLDTPVTVLAEPDKMCSQHFVLCVPFGIQMHNGTRQFVGREKKCVRLMRAARCNVGAVLTISQKLLTTEPVLRSLPQKGDTAVDVICPFEILARELEVF